MAFFEAKNISISFGGLKALNQVSFEIQKGEVFSIIGPNGAGKTTIFNCINRFYDLDEGAFSLEGQDISQIKPHEVAEMGIARTFQNIELFKNTTVLDNLILGRHRRRRSNVFTEALFSRSVQNQELESRERAEEIIDFLDLEAFREQRVVNLPYGVQKTVELGRALAMDPKLLLLDEPSLGLAPLFVKKIFDIIEEINRMDKTTILLVEQNANIALQTASRGYVLETGRLMMEDKASRLLENPEIRKAYLGE